MSTKAIREALRALKTVVVELGPMMPGHASALAGCDDALAEVEAIEKAAGPAWCALEESVRQIHRLECAPEPSLTTAVETMAAIARQKEEAK